MLKSVFVKAVVTLELSMSIVQNIICVICLHRFKLIEGGKKMRKKLLPIVTIAVIMSLAMATFAGCLKKNEEETGEVGNEVKEVSAEVTYPIKSDQTLTYWLILQANVTAGGKGAKNLNETPFDKEMQKQSGIKVEYVYPTGSASEQLNLMIASGEMPDIIEWSWPSFKGGPDKLIDDEVILKLNDVFDKYAPNLKKILKTEPELDKSIKTDTGAYYVFPWIREPNIVAYGPIIRGDWLSELGLEMPQTIDDWEKMLREFKNKKNAGAPLSAYAGDLYSIFSGAFGVRNGYYLQDGKIKYGITDPRFKDFLTTMRKWYKDGLIDPNYATLSGKVLDSNLMGGQTGATIAYAGSGIGVWMNAMASKDPKFDLVGSPYPVAKKGDKYVGDYFSGNTNKLGLNFGSYGCAINPKSPNIELAARFLDFGYTEKGKLAYNFGTEGVSYTMVNGQPKYTDEILKNPNGLSVGQAIAQYGRASNSGPFVQMLAYETQYMTLKQQNDARKNWTDSQGINVGIPTITPLTEEASTLTSLKNDINTYVNDMILKFIIGKEPIENFDKFAEHIKQLNVDKVLEINQAALARYNKR
jgi:putative aldouronate transport system substrate-binding protein